MFGSSSQHIEIIVISAPFDVRIPQDEYIGTELQPEIEIPCIISTESKYPLTTKWYFILNGDEFPIEAAGGFYKVICCSSVSTIPCELTENSFLC